MLLLISLLNLCEALHVSVHSHQPLTAVELASHLILGFKDYPPVIWTSDKELFPELAKVLIKVAERNLKPVELWQQTYVRWHRHLKFAPGMPFYAIFPPTLPMGKENFMMEMLDDFTACNSKDVHGYGVQKEQMNECVFLFLSTIHDGSQEVPSVLQKQKYNKNYCYTPTQLFFLKYKFLRDESALIELESLRAIRVRCHQADQCTCTELVQEGGTNDVLSYLSSDQVRNLIQVKWRKTHSTNVFMHITDLVYYKGEWEVIQEFYLDRSLVGLRRLNFYQIDRIQFIELIDHVNITVTGVQPSTTTNYHDIIVGYISPNQIHNMYTSGLSLVGSIEFVMIYGADTTSRYNPLTAKSLLGACGKLVLLLIFGFIVLISALRMRKYRLKDFINVVISLLAPLISQSCPYQNTRLNILYYIWMISIWFSTVMYLSFLQSQRISPDLEVGNETFKDLEERQMSFYAGDSTYVYIGQNYIFYSEKSETLSRLASIIQNTKYGRMSEEEFRKFFELSNCAYVILEAEVRPMSKVLTQAYSKNYHVLPEKIYPQLEWSRIYIPQGEYVIEAFKGVKESGIYEYWHQTYLEKLEVSTESVFRERLIGKKEELDALDGFSPLSMSDSVLLEIMVLFGLIVSVLVTVQFSPVVWVGCKQWICSKGAKLVSWVVTEDW